MHEPVVFFFAHQDDEYGVFGRLGELISEGIDVWCIYLTDGASRTRSELRNSESLRVLESFGVTSDRVVFAGQALGVGDGKLISFLNTVEEWTTSFLNEIGPFKEIYVPAWEGGHPDHDLTNAILRRVIRVMGLSTKCFQFPLYHSAGNKNLLFHAMECLPSNGPVIQKRILLKKRLRYFLLIRHYRSQWRTWIGLFIPVFFSIVIKGDQQLQEVAIDSPLTKPHPGRLFYEIRGWAQFGEVQHAVAEL
jgi:LmbE family N-acetylglucosaminyl deacetylase